MKHHGHPRFYEVLEEWERLHDVKNRHYATSDNPLGNFDRVGFMLGMWGISFKPGDPFNSVKAAFVYKIKQIDAIGKILGQGDRELIEGQEVEGLTGRFDDVGVYSAIERVIVEEILEKTKREPEETGPQGAD